MDQNNDSAYNDYDSTTTTTMTAITTTESQGACTDRFCRVSGVVLRFFATGILREH